MVGIVFAKMTRPKFRTQSIQFSKNAVICQIDGHLSMMFRVGDIRKSHVISASVRAKLIHSEQTKGDCIINVQTELAVNADNCKGDVFLIWPVSDIHKIDEHSPFYYLSASDFVREKFEIVVILEGSIESTGPTTQARSSHLPHEIHWGQQFGEIVKYKDKIQAYEIDHAKFDNTVAVPMPLCSAAELAG